jgi:hypothetical protein
MRVAYLSIVATVLLTTGACSKREPPPDYSTVEMIGARNMFMGGVITPTPSSGDFLVIVELTPAKHDDATKMCNLLRAGHTVALRLREEAGEPPILVRDLTSFGVVIRCNTLDEAKRVIDRLHAWPSR